MADGTNPRSNCPETIDFEVGIGVITKGLQALNKRVDGLFLYQQVGMVYIGAL